MLTEPTIVLKDLIAFTPREMPRRQFTISPVAEQTLAVGEINVPRVDQEATARSRPDFPTKAQLAPAGGLIDDLWAIFNQKVDRTIASHERGKQMAGEVSFNGVVMRHFAV